MHTRAHRDNRRCKLREWTGADQPSHPTRPEFYSKGIPERGMTSSNLVLGLENFSPLGHATRQFVCASRHTSPLGLRKRSPLGLTRTKVRVGGGQKENEKDHWVLVRF